MLPRMNAADLPADPTELDACGLSAAIHARRLSCREAMQACLARIGRLNPQANAIVNLAPAERLLAEADACDAELAQGRSRGWLHGVPQAPKDAVAVTGFPTTMGSPLLADAVAREDGLLAARTRAAGAIFVGKTNMPEFGLGSHTFNALFGATPNPWDPAVSAGGSSGGAAAALALRLLPVADGSDFMGSLRNPAAWNHVWGLRPTQGRVPLWPAADTWVSQLGTEGPMARSVRDLARLLHTQAGFDARVPLSLAAEPPPAEVVAASLKGLRIGWLADLGGHLAVEDGLLACHERVLARLAGEGAVVEPAAFGVDLDALWQAWLVWRRALVAPKIALLLRQPGARERIKPEALWEHDQAQGLTFTEFMRASEVRSAFRADVAALFERFDLLALPATQAWPFPLAERWPQAIAGRTMDTYHRWMACTLYATFAGVPALSLPAGFHANGRWPCGLQLVGPPLGEARLLGVAAAWEALEPALLARRPD
jgi:amidase